MQDKQFMKEMLTDGARPTKRAAWIAARFSHFVGVRCCVERRDGGRRRSGGRPRCHVELGWPIRGMSRLGHWDAVHGRTGKGLSFDTSGPLEGKIKEMVDSGNVTADVADADLFQRGIAWANGTSGAD